MEDYGYNLTFSFTPVRADGVKGQPVFAKETGVVFPPPPIVHEVVITVRPFTPRLHFTPRLPHPCELDPAHCALHKGHAR